MTVRRRNDAAGYRRGAMGIDGDKGGDYTKPHGSGDSEWYKTSDHKERSYSRNTKRGQDQWTEVGATDAGLRNKADFGYSAQTRDVFDDVQANDGPRGGASAAIRYGVNKAQ